MLLSVEDILAQASFHHYCLGTPAADVAYWQQWLAQHPEQEPVFRQAEQLFWQLHAQPRVDETAELAKFKQLFAQQFPTPATVRLRPRWGRWAAASLLLALAAGGIWWWWQSQFIVYHTAYGETRQIWLPDSSRATLNGHSRLRLRAQWASGQPREVYLEEGEAFFAVRHQPQHQKFTVMTDAGFQVEVLGTEFEVANRPHKAQVVLQSGQVRVQFADPARPAVVLAPNQMLKLNQAQSAARPQPVKAEQHTAWTDRRLVLDRTPLAEVAQTLRDTYGLEVEIADDSIGRRTITGEVPLANLELLLQALETSFDLKVTRQGNRLRLENQP
jgi:ferric-dicitrate binding protein FerR (iron transport regulator)